jgi:hypothetical protein
MNSGLSEGNISQTGRERKNILYLTNGIDSLPLSF